MTYRVQYRLGRRWLSIGLDCLDRHDITQALAMAPVGAAVRVRLVGGSQWS
jgi:lipoprotein NlpI